MIAGGNHTLVSVLAPVRRLVTEGEGMQYRMFRRSVLLAYRRTSAVCYFHTALNEVRNCGTLFRHGFAVPPSPRGKALGSVRVVFPLTGRYELLRFAQDDTVGAALIALLCYSADRCPICHSERSEAEPKNLDGTSPVRSRNLPTWYAPKGSILWVVLCAANLKF